MAARTVWFAMFAMHAFWFVRSLGSADVLMATRLSLIAAIVLFALKAIDVSFLRVRWTRRSVVSACLIVLLLHGGAINRSLDATADSFWLWLPVALTIPVIGRPACLGLYRWIVGQWARLAASLRGVLLQLHGFLYARIKTLLIKRYRRTQAPLRAPPRIVIA